INRFSLEGRIAIDTGPGSGIGQRIADGLPEAGAFVACFDLDTSSGLVNTVERVQSVGRKAVALRGEVTRAEDLTNAVESAEKSLGPLSLAVNCAGVANAAPAEEMPLSQWQKMLDINLTGIFLSCQAEAKAMLLRR